MGEIILSIILLIIGMFLLIKGADFFVDGSSSIAKALKIPSLVIGLTLVSIGTSCPELSVSITSSIKHMNDLSFGNVIGSNIFNTFMVIGVSSLFVPMILSKNMLKFDIPILIIIYVVLILFAFVITPNTIDFFEGLVLLLMMIAYMTFLILRSKHEEQVEEIESQKKNKMWVNILFVIGGLIGIVLGGSLVVNASKTIALKLGMSELLVGLTIVAVGTSLPELVTSMVAAKKGENDIAIGNAVGSSIFNVILILSISTMINPIPVPLGQIVDVVVMLVSAVLLILFTFKSKKFTRTHGIIFILIYAVYLTYIILRNFIPALAF